MKVHGLVAEVLDVFREERVVIWVEKRYPAASGGQAGGDQLFLGTVVHLKNSPT